MKFDDEDTAGLNLNAVLPTEPRGFTLAQMIVCDECLRANAPTRAECLYCTAPLPVTEESLRLRQPSLRPLEKWEQGFNCILMPDADAGLLSNERLAEAAGFLRMEIDALKKIVAAQQPLPLARAAAHDDANTIKQRLADMQSGFDVLIVADNELALESRPLVRLRALELTEDGLIGHSVGNYSAEIVSWERIGLLVNGRLYVRRVEVQERLKRSGSEGEIIEAHEFGADEALLDIYVALDSVEWIHWRIGSAGFDFSCLGERKTLLAAQNFQTMIEVLRQHATHARFDDSYKVLRHALATAWPPEQRTESRGWQRERPGKYSTEAVTTSDNEKQFTLYSRLQNYLRQREKEFTK